MKNGKFLLGMVMGAAVTSVVAGSLSVGVRAGAEPPQQPDPAKATAPFVYKSVVIDDHNAIECPANAAMYASIPGGGIELDLGLLHNSLPYVMDQKQVTVLRISTRVLMDLRGAKSIESSLHAAIEGAERQTKPNPTTRPNDGL